MSKVINQIKILFSTPDLGLYTTAYVAFLRNYKYLYDFSIISHSNITVINM